MSSTYDATTLSLPQGAPPELIAAINDAARDRLARHGGAAFAASREAAAAHEAGHAIVGTHEGIAIRRIKIDSRSDPMFGTRWGGHCFEVGWGWTAGPDTSADDDFKRARFIIAGLAGEVVCGLDKPGSSIDEEAMSQMLGI